MTCNTVIPSGMFLGRDESTMRRDELVVTAGTAEKVRDNEWGP